MNKQEFLAELQKGLSGLPQGDIQERLIFYGEMIDDRVEEGLSEEDAVAEIGSVQEVVTQILADIPLTKLVKEKVKSERTLKAWEIVLLVLGSPVWFPLLLAAAIIFFSVYIVLWSVIFSLYAVDFAFAVTGISGIAIMPVYIMDGNIPGAIMFLGAALVFTGLAILLFLGFNQITKGILNLSRKILLGIKSLFVRKEEA